VRGRRVGPWVIERTKARALAGDGRQRVQEVAGRTRQAVEAQHVALGELVEDAAQLGAVGACIGSSLPLGPGQLPS
jgi:uncharacterized protein YbjQ (UPF0145 family)